MPERPKGTGCKPVGSAYGGSNPPAPTFSSRATSRISYVALTRFAHVGRTLTLVITTRPLVVTAVAASFLASVFAGAAAAKFTPAWTYVPRAVRAELAARSGTLYLPARTPLFYRYRSGATLSGGILTVRFTNRVRVRNGLWRWTSKSFVWQVRPLAKTAACANWGGAQKTLQVGGNKVYWSNGTAWRCVTDRNGRVHVLAALQGGALPDVALAIVVASGLDVAGRS